MSIKDLFDNKGVPKIQKSVNSDDLVANVESKEFVDSKIPWVHFDIAGTAWGVKPDSVNPKGSATGVGVRLVLDMFGV